MGLFLYIFFSQLCAEARNCFWRTPNVSLFKYFYVSEAFTDCVADVVLQLPCTIKNTTRHVFTDQSKITMYNSQENYRKVSEYAVRRPIPISKIPISASEIASWRALIENDFSQIGRQHLYRRISKRGNSIIIKIFSLTRKRWANTSPTDFCCGGPSTFVFALKF